MVIYTYWNANEKRIIMIRNTVIWTSTSLENPSNNRPVTVVVKELKGTHTAGAYYDSNTDSWVDMRSDKKIEEEIICWADIEIPEQFLF